MEILQVSPTYYPYIGGVEECVKQVSEQLARDHEVTVFTCDPSRKLPRRECINNVKVRRFTCCAPNKAYYFSLEMLSALKRVHPDVLHAHNYHALPLLFSVCSHSGTYVVTPYYHGHGHTAVRNILLMLYQPIGGIALKRADHIACVSQYEKNLLRDHFRIGDEKMTVIPVGIDKKEFQVTIQENGNKEDTKDSTKRILCVSRLEHYKGIHYVIQALSHLPPQFCLDIVGTGPYKKVLQNLVHHLNFESRVTFFEPLPRKVLLQKYLAAQVFVLLSEAESYGISIAEALALKTPCIVANTSALSEWVDNSSCFGISYPIDVEKLACRIERVSEIIPREIDLPTWEETAEKLESLYKKGCKQNLESNQKANRR